MTVTAAPPAIPLLGVEAAGRHVDGVDGLGRRDVHVVVRQPDVHVRGAVGAGRVDGVGLAVDVGRQRARRRVGLGVAERHRRRAGHQVEQRLIVAEAVERHRR